LKIYGTVNILGKFWPQRTSDIVDVVWTANDEGRILYDLDNNHFYYGTSSKWQKISDIDDLFSIGTNLIFASVLPTGWNIKDVDDKVIMLTDYSNQIGDIGGSWIITGGSSAGNHKHFTTAGLGLSDTNVNAKVRTGDNKMANKSHKHTFTNTGNHSHTFDGSWRPSSVKLAVGVYQG